jgi:hypothetical protein
MADLKLRIPDALVEHARRRIVLARRAGIRAAYDLAMNPDRIDELREQENRLDAAYGPLLARVSRTRWRRSRVPGYFAFASRAAVRAHELRS